MDACTALRARHLARFRICVQIERLPKWTQIFANDVNFSRCSERTTRSLEALSSSRNTSMCMSSPPSATLALTGALRQTRLLLLLMLLHAPHVPAPFEWEWADQEDTQLDPWTPCDKWQADGTQIRGFCRLSCTTRWSFAPKRLDCRQLPADPLLRRSHSRGLERFQTMSQQSFSAVNSGQQADADA